jgi:hypothetical protein
MCSPLRSSGFERPLGRAAAAILLATSTIDAGGAALAEHIFAIETILNITATASAEIFAALFCPVDPGASLHSVHTLRP